MTQHNPESRERPDWEEVVSEIRTDPNLAQEFSRKEKHGRWHPKEIKLGVSPWVVRAVIALLALALIVEVFLLLPTMNLSLQPSASAPVGEHTSAEEVFDDYPPTPTIAPPPPTATDPPPEPTSEPIEIDKSF